MSTATQLHREQQRLETIRRHDEFDADAFLAAVIKKHLVLVIFSIIAFFIIGVLSGPFVVVKEPSAHVNPQTAYRP